MRIYFDIPDGLGFRSAKLTLFAKDMTPDEFIAACREKDARIGSSFMEDTGRGWFPVLMAHWKQAGRQVEVFGPQDDRDGPVRVPDWRRPRSAA